MSLNGPPAPQSSPLAADLRRSPSKNYYPKREAPGAAGDAVIGVLCRRLAVTTRSPRFIACACTVWLGVIVAQLPYCLRFLGPEPWHDLLLSAATFCLAATLLRSPRVARRLAARRYELHKEASRFQWVLLLLFALSVAGGLLNWCAEQPPDSPSQSCYF